MKRRSVAVFLAVGLSLWGGGAADVLGQPVLSEVRWQTVGESFRVLLSGQGFGTRPTSYPTAPGLLNVAWHTFDDGNFSGGGWDFWDAGDPTQWSLVPGGRTGRGYSAKKVYRTNDYGSVYVNQTGTTGKWFISFWFMMPPLQQSGKFFRIYGGHLPNANYSTSLILSSGGNGTYPTVDFNLRGYNECYECGTSGSSVRYSSPQKFEGNRWSRVDIVVRDHAALDEFTVYLDGQWQWSGRSADGERWVRHPFNGDGHTLDIGTDLNGPAPAGDPTWPAAGAYHLDDLYLDYSWARVEICDKAVWTDCRHKEIQPLRQWSASQVVADFNPGSFAAGEEVYIYLVDDDGQVSNSQKLVVPGSRGQSRPKPPTKLRNVPRPNSR